MNSFITVVIVSVLSLMLLLVYGLYALLIPFSITMVYLFMAGAIIVLGLVSVRIWHGD